jgi:hypothetical protein
LTFCPTLYGTGDTQPACNAPSAGLIFSQKFNAKFHTTNSSFTYNDAASSTDVVFAGSNLVPAYQRGTFFNASSNASFLKNSTIRHNHTFTFDTYVRLEAAPANKMTLFSITTMPSTGDESSTVTLLSFAIKITTGELLLDFTKNGGTGAMDSSKESALTLAVTTWTYIGFSLSVDPADA